MLPDLPSLLLQTDPQALKRLATLVNSIKSTPAQTTLKNYFIQYYLNCSRSKIQQLKSLPKLNDLIQSQNKNNKSKKTTKMKTYPEQVFLINAIHNNMNWKQISEQLNFKLVQKRADWSYSYYLTFSILNKINKNLAYFISIHLFERSWLGADTTFAAVKGSKFLTQKVESLIERDPKNLAKIHFQFYKSLLLSIKYDEDIQTTLKRMNYINLITLKKQQNEDINFYTEEWIAYLCSKYSKNKQSEIPIIRIQKKKFILKWSKSKFPAWMKKQFDAKFKYVMNNIENFEEAFINQIQVVLLKGIKEKTNWDQVKQTITYFVIRMNQIEEQYSYTQQKTMKSVRSSRSIVARRMEILGGSQMVSQNCSFDAGYIQQQNIEIKPISPDTPQKISQKKIQRQPKEGQQQETYLSMNRYYKCIQTQTSFIIQQQKIKQRKEINLNPDQEIILSYIQIQKNSFPDIDQKDLMQYYKQNIDQIQKKYTDTFLFFSADQEKVWNIQNLDLKTLISILISISYQNKLNKQIKKQSSQIYFNKTSIDMNKKTSQEFDKINRAIKSKLNTKKSQRGIH